MRDGSRPDDPRTPIAIRRSLRRRIHLASTIARDQGAAYGEVHLTVASTLNSSAPLRFEKEITTKRSPYFTRMADICRTVYGEHHYWYATATFEYRQRVLRGKSLAARGEAVPHGDSDLYTKRSPQRAPTPESRGSSSAARFCASAATPKPKRKLARATTSS